MKQIFHTCLHRVGHEHLLAQVLLPDVVVGREQQLQQPIFMHSSFHDSRLQLFRNVGEELAVRATKAFYSLATEDDLESNMHFVVRFGWSEVGEAFFAQVLHLVVGPNEHGVSSVDDGFGLMLLFIFSLLFVILLLLGALGHSKSTEVQLLDLVNLYSRFLKNGTKKVSFHTK